MARNRRRFRGGSGDAGNGYSTNDPVGVIEPPPFSVPDFVYVWKNWLNELYLAVSRNIATKWYNIVAVSTSVDGATYTVKYTDQLMLADPDTGALQIDLPESNVEDGITFTVKNIDESGTYALTVNPGTNKIDDQPAAAAPATTDLTVAALASHQLVYDSELDIWWSI